MSKKVRVPQEITDLLEEAGDYDLVYGSRHIKIMMNGHQVGVLPHAKSRDGQSRGRQHKNTVAYIKRKLREFKEAAMQPSGDMISQN